jgi:hypothetical protein
MNRLPPEIARRILSTLSPRTLAQLARTSKAHTKMTRSLLENLHRRRPAKVGEKRRRISNLRKNKNQPIAKRRH